MIVSESGALHFTSHPHTPESNYDHLVGESMKLITLVSGMVVIAVAVIAAAQAPVQKPMSESFQKLPRGRWKCW
jgi:hypothetical protein